MTTSSPCTAGPGQPSRAVALLTVVADRMTLGMIAAGCVFGAVSPSALIRQRHVFLASTSESRASR